MKTRQLPFAATHLPGVPAPPEVSPDADLLRRLKARAAELPIDGNLPAFTGANAWLNSPPLTPAGLRGKVVAIDFWTFTCINWLRTLPYVRAWAKKYGNKGLVVIGVHTPEFPFEHDIENVRRAAKDLKVEYPIAVDSDYAVWNAFDNHYWPALYLVDAQGRIRNHQYGEGAYEMSEMVIQQLLAEAGFSGFRDDLVSVDPQGPEIAADWSSQESPETYLGYERGDTFASAGGVVPDAPHRYTLPTRLRPNDWALAGNWTITDGAAKLIEAGGRIAFRFHARDVNLVMGPARKGDTVRFRVFLDGKVGGAVHGSDVDAQGQGTTSEQRTYQLIRQSGEIEDRTFEIEFLDPGGEAYCFTFG
jgi:thiol-disulfide isomerase/thioredoxin